MRSARAASLAALLATQAGCWGWRRADAGAVTSTTMIERRQGVALGADAALAPRDSAFAFDLGLRAKVTESRGDGALFVGLLVMKEPQPVGVYALGGTNLIQVGSARAALSFGMFSPSAEVGLTIRLPKNGRDPQLLTLGTRLEYDVRFTSQPHEAFWTLNIGYALYDER